MLSAIRKKSERVFLTPGGSCNRITRMVAIKIERKGGNYYYYGNKESEKKKREELADKKKAEEEKKIKPLDFNELDTLFVLEKCSTEKYIKIPSNINKMRFNLNNGQWDIDVKDGIINSTNGETDYNKEDIKFSNLLEIGAIQTKKYSLDKLFSTNHLSSETNPIDLSKIKGFYKSSNIWSQGSKNFRLKIQVPWKSISKKERKILIKEFGFYIMHVTSGNYKYKELIYVMECEDRYATGSEDIKDKNIKITELLSPKNKKPKPSPDDNKVVAAGSGSGFFVSKDGHIITNHHVVDGCKTTKVNFRGSEIEAKVLSIDKVNDIAILKTNINPNNIFPVSNEDVSLLEDVVVAGYPKGKKISSAIKTHKGVVTALAGAGDNYSNFQTDATINAGNSGGPIVNQKGNIVGIAVATWAEEGVQGIHFGIKSSTLKTFASSNSLKFLPPNNEDLTNKELGELITEATVYLECHMTIANIKKMVAEANNKKAFYNEYK